MTLAFNDQSVTAMPFAFGSIREITMAEDGTLNVKTRYGDYEVEGDRVIQMPQGLIGFANHHRFVLIDLQREGAERFMLLQCVDEPSISFHVLPVDPSESGLAEDDIKEMTEQIGFPINDTAILFVVTIRRGDEGIELTANMRAPVLVNTSKMSGIQHVLLNDEYPLRQRLN